VSAITDNVKNDIKYKSLLLLNKEQRRKYIFNFGVIGCNDSFLSRPIYPGESSSGTHILWGWIVARLEIGQSASILCN
jgi:hypothetical protein